MTSPDPAAILEQINAAREQTYQNIALAQGILTQANAAASAAARDRAAIQAIAQQTVSVDTSVGTRVFAGDRMIYGDTGLRDIFSLTTSGVTANRPLYLRRTGDVVVVSIERVTLGADPDNVFVRLPYGFRPGPSFIYTKSTSYWSNEIERAMRVATGGQIYIYPMAEGDVTNFSMTWQTSNNWPTELPGTPA